MDVRPGYKQTEVGVIPEDWQLSPVGLMGEVVTGKALAVHAPGQQRPYLRTKNVFDGRIDIDNVLTMPMTDSQFKQFMVNDGDVLLNEGQSLDLVGRCALYKGEYPEPCAIQNQLLRFRARPGVSGVYASHLFRYCQQTGVFSRVALQTTSIAHLGGKRFEQLLLPWPPTEAEQHAIAAALADADALITSLDRLIAKKRDVKQGAMQELLARKRRLPGFRGEWEIKKMDKIAHIQRGASPRPIDSSIWFDSMSNIGWIRIADISEAKGRYLYKTRDYLSEKGIAQSRFLPSGSLIMSIAATVGMPIITKIDACIHDGFVSFTQLRDVDQTFLYYTLKELGGVFRKMGQTGSQSNINSGLVRDCEISLPLKDEQTAIASVLSDMDTDIATLESKREKTKQIKQGMMQELLTGRIRLV